MEWSGLTALDLLAHGLSREEKDVARNIAPAQAMIDRYGLKNLTRTPFAELQERVGMERDEWRRFNALLMLGQRVSTEQRRQIPLVCADDAMVHLEDLADQPKEHVVLLSLNNKLFLIGRHTVHVGTASESYFDSREILRLALRDDATSFIVAHNHPSGDPEPSPEDLQVTKKLAEAAKIVGIGLLDHVIVGAGGRFVSLARRGVLK